MVIAEEGWGCHIDMVYMLRKNRGLRNLVPRNFDIWREILTFKIKKYIEAIGYINGGKFNNTGGKF